MSLLLAFSHPLLLSLYLLCFFYPYNSFSVCLSLFLCVSLSYYGCLSLSLPPSLPLFLHLLPTSYPPTRSFFPSNYAYFTVMYVFADSKKSDQFFCNGHPALHMVFVWYKTIKFTPTNLIYILTVRVRKTGLWIQILIITENVSGSIPKTGAGSQSM